ncbi:MAG: hypothetical protein J3Q66DRAFT_330526 [Benniella sp.]|nr:MAG: hypothetical protein J3Q66DRAFT_330526 [Benniella sp.]
MAKMNPLDIPEILAQVGSYITLWGLDEDRIYQFQPKDMLSCIQVSQHFRNTLLPILWYAFDEWTMSTVPADIIRKYAPYFRIHYNYGFRQDYPTHDRGPCTRLIQLTMPGRLNSLERHDIEFIKSNRDLRVLGGSNWFRFPAAIHHDAFSSFRRLEHLRYKSYVIQHETHQRLFQPISGTLKSLHLMCRHGSLGLQGLVFPRLEELVMELFDPQDTWSLLENCPNLRALGQFMDSPEHNFNYMVRALNAEKCPTLKRLKWRMSNTEQSETFATTLERRSGLQSLDLYLGSVNNRLITAINHHASSLTRLRAHSERRRLPIMAFILGIISSCGQLKDLIVEGIMDEAIDPLMARSSWKNPDALESFRLVGDISLCGETLGWTTMGTFEEQPELPIEGWRLSSGSSRDVQNPAFLRAISHVAQGYGRLRIISLNCVNYERVCP